MDRYSFIVSDLHRLLVAGLPAHCETFWTLLSPAAFEQVWRNQPIVGEHLPPYVTPPHDGFPRWASNICARSIGSPGFILIQISPFEGSIDSQHPKDYLRFSSTCGCARK